jgi:hypothetical protein
MPEFVNTASHFDNDPVYDGYSGALLFRGQATTFNESSPDGSVNKRRTLSVRPGTTMPARGVVGIYDDRWIIGDHNTDGFFGKAVRETYWTKKATQLAEILKPGDMLAGVVAVPAYVNTEYLKDVVNTASDAEYDPFWEVFMHTSELVTKGMYIRWPGHLVRVRSVHLDIAGFNNAQSDEIDDSSLITVTTEVGGVYDPVSESTVGGGPANFPAVLLDAYKIYRYQTEADPKVVAGDMFLVVQLTTPSEVGRVFQIDGENWRVVNRIREIDAYNLQMRRA